MMHLTRVLLPAPFSPSRACTLPGLSRNDTSSSATRLPKCLLIPRAESCGGGSRAGTGAIFGAGRSEGAVSTEVAGMLIQGLSKSARGDQLGGLVDGGAMRGAAQHHDQQSERVG